MSKRAIYYVDEAAFIPDAMYSVPMCKVCSLVLRDGVCREHGDADAQVAYLRDDLGADCIAEAW